MAHREIDMHSQTAECIASRLTRKAFKKASRKRLHFTPVGPGERAERGSAWQEPLRTTFITTLAVIAPIAGGIPQRVMARRLPPVCDKIANLSGAERRWERGGLLHRLRWRHAHFSGASEDRVHSGVKCEGSEEGVVTAAPHQRAHHSAGIIIGKVHRNTRTTC
ncbi:hypothetical protein MRX96_005149 [Rhipicephalus microplus]